MKRRESRYSDVPLFRRTDIPTRLYRTSDKSVLLFRHVGISGVPLFRHSWNPVIPTIWVIIVSEYRHNFVGITIHFWRGYGTLLSEYRYTLVGIIIKNVGIAYETIHNAGQYATSPHRFELRHLTCRRTNVCEDEIFLALESFFEPRVWVCIFAKVSIIHSSLGLNSWRGSSLSQRGILDARSTWLWRLA